MADTKYSEGLKLARLLMVLSGKWRGLTHAFECCERRITPIRTLNESSALSKAPYDDKELLDLCYAGRLYDIVRWIEAERPGLLGKKKMPEAGHGSVRRCLRCLTNRATIEKLGLSGTVAAVNARPLHRNVRTGAATLATLSQRVLDFLLRTLERPYRSNNFASLQFKTQNDLAWRYIYRHQI
jgi:hypothetical protein